MFPVVAIDHGLKWIGLAISDQEGYFAWPLSNVSTDHIFEYLDELIPSRGVLSIVVGYPLMLDGTPGQQCLEVDRFVIELARYHIPVHRQDERLTNRKRGSDMDAAVQILERWLIKLAST